MQLTFSFRIKIKYTEGRVCYFTFSQQSFLIFSYKMNVSLSSQVKFITFFINFSEPLNMKLLLLFLFLNTGCLFSSLDFQVQSLLSEQDQALGLLLLLPYATPNFRQSNTFVKFFTLTWLPFLKRRASCLKASLSLVLQFLYRVFLNYVFSLHLSVFQVLCLYNSRHIISKIV